MSKQVKPGLDAGTPLLMLPVRIETRFVDSAQSSELLVRIYPDQISVDAHDPQLTVGEVADGQAYWGVVWRTGTPPSDDTPIRTAWRSLGGHYPPTRPRRSRQTTTPT